MLSLLLELFGFFEGAFEQNSFVVYLPLTAFLLLTRGRPRQGINEFGQHSVNVRHARNGPGSMYGAHVGYAVQLAGFLPASRLVTIDYEDTWNSGFLIGR